MDDNESLGAIVLAAIAVMYGTYYVVDTYIRQPLGVTWEQLGFLFIGLIIAICMAIGLFLRYRDNPKRTVLEVTAVIWFPHFAIAAIMVEAARNPLIRQWTIEQETVRAAVIKWLRHIPIAVGISWFVSAFLLLDVLGVSQSMAITLASGSAALVIYGYFYFYFERPPRQADWVYFVKEYHLWQFEQKLKGIESRFEH